MRKNMLLTAAAGRSDRDLGSQAFARCGPILRTAGKLMIAIPAGPLKRFGGYINPVLSPHVPALASLIQDVQRDLRFG